MSYARWPPVLPRHRPPSSPIRSRRPRSHQIRTRRVKASHLSHPFRVPPSKTPQSLTNGHLSQYPCSSPRSHYQLLATSHPYAPNVICAHLAHVSNDTDVYASDTLPDHVHPSILHAAISLQNGIMSFAIRIRSSPNLLLPAGIRQRSFTTAFLVSHCT